MRRHAVAILSAILMAQVALYYGVSWREVRPEIRSWKEFPAEIGEWRLATERTMEPSAFAELSPDEYFEREYTSLSGSRLSLLVLYYRTQRRGVLPHSPQSCLPGSGWRQVSLDTIPFAPHAGSQESRLTRYVVERGGTQSLVLFWFQSPRGAAPTLYGAQFQSIPGLLFHGRSDLAFVRVVVPVTSAGREAVERTGREFVESIQTLIRDWMQPV
jgi:EpsI family protein